MSALAIDNARGTGEELLLFLRRRLSVGELHYCQRPTVLPDGWETNTWRFQLDSPSPLPAELLQPLVLRNYSCARGLPRLTREFDVQGHLFRRGYPVAKPLLLEEGEWPLGGPFMLMEWVPGKTLLQHLLDHPMAIWSYPGRMAELQVRLNTLPVLDFPAPKEPHLSRSLKHLDRIVHACGFAGMAAGLDWLEVHQPDPPSHPRIVHLDFHPLNLLVDEGQFRAVLDWSDADVGDQDADVASTLLLLEAAPVKMVRWRDWLASLPGKGILRRRYLHAYRSLLPIDDEKLNYYLAWAAFRRLATWGQWLHLGPEGTGIKKSSTRRLTPRRLRFLARYFEKQTDVEISLPTRGAAARQRVPPLTFEMSPDL